MSYCRKGPESTMAETKPNPIDARCAELGITRRQLVVRCAESAGSLATLASWEQNIHRMDTWLEELGTKPDCHLAVCQALECYDLVTAHDYDSKLCAVREQLRQLQADHEAAGKAHAKTVAELGRKLHVAEVNALKLTEWERVLKPMTEAEVGAVYSRIYAKDSTKVVWSRLSLIHI
jgi:hypothetical protein